MCDLTRLKQVIASCNCISISTFEEDYAFDLVAQAAKDLGRELAIWSASQGIREHELLPSNERALAPHEALKEFATRAPGSICVMFDLLEYLRDNRTLRCWRDLVRRFTQNGSMLVMIDYCDQSPEVVKTYGRVFELSYPDAKELMGVVRDTIQEVHNKTPIQVGISKQGLVAIINNLRGLTRRQAKDVIRDAVLHNRKFDDNDLTDIIATKRRMLCQGSLLEFVNAPLDLNQIGGMAQLKRWLELRNSAFTAEAQKYGIRPPRGIFMLGVQGCGKSLCAKAIATAWKQPLLRLDVASLYNRYIGESEANLKRALAQAEAMAPMVLWVDEIEKAFASAASQNVDGGLSQRMFGTLLTWMQEHKTAVFVAATANNIESLPPELLRKGRFDEIFFVNLPTTEVRKEIFQIHLAKIKRNSAQFDLDMLSAVSQGYSGAEIEQAIQSALHEAFANQTDVSTDMIVEALKQSPPLSVTMAERVEALVRWSKGRCVPVD